MAKVRKAELAAEIGRLYGLPLGEFTTARNALAKSLDKSGDEEAAAQVRALAKPTPSAWAVNQLFARERAAMERLLAAGERAREAQQHLVAGRGPEPLRKALEEERKARDDLRRRAAAILEEDGGRKASAAVLERIAADLDALALSPAAAEEAGRRGWLDRDLDPPGFEVLLGLKLPGERRGLRLVPPPPAPRAKPKPAGAPERPARPGRRATVEERRRQEQAERARQEREERTQARLRERVERVREAVERAENEAAFLRREADQAEKAAAEAEREAEEARRRAESARRTAERAAERAGRAEEKLARAQAELAGVEEG